MARADLDQKPSSGGRTERRHTVRELIPRAQEGEHGGEHDQGRPASEEHDRDTRVGERAQEDEREDQEGAGRRSHGEGTTGHGPPGVRHRLLQRGGGVVPGQQLFTKPADDEEAVIDGQAQSQDGGQVHRVDRDRCDAVEDPEHEQRADDRHGADREGHGGSDERTEHEQEEQEGERYGERLGMQQIAFDHRVDFMERGTEATDGKGDAAVRGLQCGGDDRFPVRDLVLIPGDASDDHGVPVVGDTQEAAGLRAPIGHDVGHVGLRRQLLRQVGTGGLHGSAVDGARRRVDQDEDVVRAVVEFRGEDGRRTHRLLRRDVESSPGELRRDIPPQQPCQHDEEPGDHHDDLSVPDRGPGHVTERTLGRGRSRLRMPREPTHGM